MNLEKFIKINITNIHMLAIFRKIHRYIDNKETASRNNNNSSSLSIKLLIATKNIMNTLCKV